MILSSYGEENWDALPTEINTCLVKIAKRENEYDDIFRKFLKPKPNHWVSAYRLDKYERLRPKLDAEFRAYHKRQQGTESDKVNVDGMSGIEFQTYIAKVLRENGYEDVRGTPATGDQGADLIAKKDGKTIIIQAKRYQGSVGNKSIQEVIAAVSFYDGDEGWVVTNSTFTPSAKALAQKSNTKLIDGELLIKIEEFLKKQNNHALASSTT